MEIHGGNECNIVPSLQDANIYFAFIDGRELQFKFANNVVLSNDLSKEEHKQIEKHMRCIVITK